MSLLDEVQAVYQGAQDGGSIAIQPFVGTAFTQGTGALRIVCVGINSYISPKDWPRILPEWFASWFRQQKYKFAKGAAKAGATVGEALQSAGWGRFDGLESCWTTNAIKTYLPEATGKNAHQVPPEAFDRDATIWRRELDLMAAHDVLPHAVVVLGEPQWWPTCRAFRPQEGWAYDHLKLAAYQTTEGPLFHHLNRVTVEVKGAQRSLLVVRVPHPAAFGAKPRAEDIVAHPDFQRVVALGMGV
jgi:hypothetical protein